MAILKLSFFSRAISLTMSTAQSRCGVAPLPPAVPTMTGMPASMAAGIIISKSRFTELRSVNDLPAPR